jgi:phosphoribosylformylglycinamidine synthase PurS subunit
MRFEVVVAPKPEVLDPEGRAITETLRRLGVNDIKSVGVSKRFVIDLTGEANGDAAAQKALVERLSNEFLANPVSEMFTVTKI